MSSILPLLALAFALAMDAFAASLCQGAVARPGASGAVRIGAAFGSAQALMPLLGWALGLAFAEAIRDVDHWVAFLLLAMLGGRMLYASLARGEEACSPPLAGWALLGAALATSVDAGASGLTLPLLALPVLLSVAVIGAVTALLCAAGVYLGAVAGTRFGRHAEAVGGVLLVALGIKILVEHQFMGG